MPYGNYTFTARKGQSVTLAGTWRASAGGAALDLTGYSAKLTVNTWPKGGSPLYETTAITLGGAAGTFTVTVLEADTQTWPGAGPDGYPSRLIYDLSVTSGTGVTTYLLAGEILVEEDA